MDLVGQSIDSWLYFLSWGVVFIGVILILQALCLRGCLSWLIWPLVGVAMVGVVWLYARGFVL